MLQAGLRGIRFLLTFDWRLDDCLLGLRSRAPARTESAWPARPLCSRISFSDCAGAGEVVSIRSYIDEITAAAFAALETGGTFDTLGDLGLATTPFLSQSVAHRKPVLGPRGSPICLHAALGETSDVMGQRFRIRARRLRGLRIRIGQFA